MSIPGAIAIEYAVTDECPICCMEVNNNELCTPCCNKHFHKVCYDKWLIQKPVCPLCRCLQNIPDVCIIQMPVELTVDAVVQSTEIPSIPSNSYDCTCYINCRSIKSTVCIMLAIICLYGFIGFMVYSFLSKCYGSPSPISSNVTSIPPSAHI